MTTRTPVASPMVPSTPRPQWRPSGAPRSTRKAASKPSDIAPMMRIGKLKQRQLWGIAVQHNLRTKLPTRAHSIDTARTGLNEVLVGADQPTELQDQVGRRIRALARKPRKDAVWAIEVVFSLPDAHGVDERAYFEACAEWCGSEFGSPANIISAVIHRDESAPHCHVLILPIIDGRLVGSRLVGHAPIMKRRRASFETGVAQRFGLREFRSSAEILTQRTDADRCGTTRRTSARHRTKPMLCRLCAQKLLRLAAEHAGPAGNRDPADLLRAAAESFKAHAAATGHGQAHTAPAITAIADLIATAMRGKARND